MDFWLAAGHRNVKHCSMLQKCPAVMEEFA